MSTHSEASAADVALLIGRIRDECISTVFIENVANPRLLQQIARKTDAEMCGTLFTDALSAGEGLAPTCLDMIRHNVGATTAALGS